MIRRTLTLESQTVHTVNQY